MSSKITTDPLYLFIGLFHYLIYNLDIDWEIELLYEPVFCYLLFLALWACNKFYQHFLGQ